MPVFTASERLGSLIDSKYRIERLLGHGGMGVVFEATHTWTNRRVAVKLLKPDLVEPARDARLLVEARAAAALSHANVVQVLDMGLTEDGVSYLVMELLEGCTLKDELLARGAVPAQDALRWLLPLFGAMALAHERGIVHRDLKPANIFLCRDASGREVPKLLDFGIAKLIEETGVTRSGVVLGTPSYLSPEQAAGDPEVSRAADVWALGVILYECLGGRVPFAGTATASVLHRVLNEPVPPLRAHAPAVSSALASAVERAVRRDPRLRYDDLRSFARALLVTARASGIALPEAPDPLGLPEWSSWLREEADSNVATADEAPAETPNVRALPAERGHAKQTPVRRAGVMLALALLTVAGVAAAYFLRMSAAPELATRVPVPEQAITPAPTEAPAQAQPPVVSASPIAAEPPAATPVAAASESVPASPPAHVPPAHVIRRNARANRAVAPAPADTSNKKELLPW